LQLLRIQNDLNLLAVAMRDMIDNDEPYPLTAWSAQFQRIHTDLDDAMRLEAALAPTTRTPEQSASLAGSLTQFWDASGRVFTLASEGNEKDARAQIQVTLQARQASLSTTVARFLVQNSDSEQQAAQRIIGIYDRVQHQVYVFLFATLAAILLTGFSHDPLEPAAVCAHDGALGAAQRAGAEIDFHSGVHSALYFLASCTTNSARF